MLLLLGGGRGSCQQLTGPNSLFSLVLTAHAGTSGGISSHYSSSNIPQTSVTSCSPPPSLPPSLLPSFCRVRSVICLERSCLLCDLETRKRSLSPPAFLLANISSAGNVRSRLPAVLETPEPGIPTDPVSLRDRRTLNQAAEGGLTRERSRLTRQVHLEEVYVTSCPLINDPHVSVICRGRL